jgi:hypothetical protein
LEYPGGNPSELRSERHIGSPTVVSLLRSSNDLIHSFLPICRSSGAKILRHKRVCERLIAAYGEVYAVRQRPERVPNSVGWSEHRGVGFTIAVVIGGSRDVARRGQFVVS